MTKSNLLFLRNTLLLIIVVLLIALNTSCSHYEIQTSFRKATKKIQSYHYSRIGKVNIYELQPTATHTP